MLVFGALPAAAGTVELLLSGAEPLYDQVADGMQAQLDGARMKPPLAVSRTGLADAPPAATPDLIVAIGIAACEQALDRSARAPLLCTLVPKAGFERLRNQARSSAAVAKVSALYLDQPFVRQLYLAHALAPEAQRVGLLASPRFQRQRFTAQRDARSLGLTLDVESADDERGAARAIQRLVARNDLILPIYDPAVLTPSSAKWLLHLAYQKQRPVVGFSRAYVDAGAVAAVFTEPEQIGRQTGQLVAGFFQGKRRDLPAPSHPALFRVAVNRPVAAALGLDPPSEAALASEVARRARARGDRP